MLFTLEEAVGCSLPLMPHTVIHPVKEDVVSYSRCADGERRGLSSRCAVDVRLNQRLATSAIQNCSLRQLKLKLPGVVYYATRRNGRHFPQIYIIIY